MRLELTFDDPTLEPRIREILPPGWAPARSDHRSTPFALRETGPDSYEVTIGGASAVEHASLEVALTLLDSQMRLSIAANASDWLFVHAGVVVVEDRALLIRARPSPARRRSCTRSCTPAPPILRRNRVLDDAGLVHPYPRPLSIRSNDGSPVRHDARVPPGGSPPSTSVPRRGGRDHPLPVRGPVAAEATDGRAGMLALLANTVPRRRARGVAADARPRDRGRPRGGDRGEGPGGERAARRTGGAGAGGP